jgi:hypothetical protein
MPSWSTHQAHRCRSAARRSAPAVVPARRNRGYCRLHRRPTSALTSEDARCLVAGTVTSDREGAGLICRGIAPRREERTVESARAASAAKAAGESRARSRSLRRAGIASVIKFAVKHAGAILEVPDILIGARCGLESAVTAYKAGHEAIVGGAARRRQLDGGLVGRDEKSVTSKYTMETTLVLRAINRL